jgi:hypothetical protein
MTSQIPNPKSQIPNRLGFWLLLALAAGSFYLAISAWSFGVVGFPLDDAWIHQTYARNLARSGQLAFVPGVPSTGSTAPLWSLLLSLGYLLRLPFQLWTYGLGLVFLALTGWTVARLSEHLWPEQRRLGLWVGLFCLFEWRLVWAAVSGMETILFVWLSVLLVERYLAALAGPENMQTMSRTYVGLGLIGGLLILTRPEGAGLVGLIGLHLAYHEWRQNKASKAIIAGLLRPWLLIGGGLGALVIPYIGFHLWLTGLPFPNTFYAKQTEYRIILESFPLWWRLFGNLGPPIETVQGVFRVIFIGPQLLLLPGLSFAAWLTLTGQVEATHPAPGDAVPRTLLPPDRVILIWVWWLSFLLLYGLRLPVTYQHGRYQIPAIPWVILLGVWGTSRLLANVARQKLVIRVVGRALLVSLPILVLAFTVVGARAYGRDVAFIESEMVATARWLDANTAPEQIIAAHDIGAIGYVTQRPLIDLAGLVTPEVIPMIRDEAALYDFILARQAGRLVTFPSWYRALTQEPGLTLIFSADPTWPAQAGSDHMAVYQINKP